MKVYLNKPKYHWISPYVILKKICFWEKDDDVFYNHENKPNHKYDKWVERLVPICKAIQWVWNKVDPKIEYIKVDSWDTWSMDQSLAPIILPMLKQLKATKHGYGMIDDEDVPKELRSIYALPKNEWEWDGNAEARFDWVLDEMIFAFEHIVDDSWEKEFCSGEIDHKMVPCGWDDEGKPTLYTMEHGPNHTYVCDYEGMKEVNKRIDNGLRLFGVHFRTLWDQDLVLQLSKCQQRLAKQTQETRTFRS